MGILGQFEGNEHTGFADGIFYHESQKKKKGTLPLPSCLQGLPGSGARWMRGASDKIVDKDPLELFK